MSFGHISSYYYYATPNNLRYQKATHLRSHTIKSLSNRAFLLHKSHLAITFDDANKSTKHIPTYIALYLVNVTAIATGFLALTFIVKY